MNIIATAGGVAMAHVVVLMLALLGAAGCDFMHSPQRKTLQAQVMNGKQGIQFGVEPSLYLSARLESPKVEVIPFKEYLKGGEKPNFDFHYKVIVSTTVNSSVLSKEAWPYITPKGIVHVELVSQFGVVLATGEVEHLFHIDGSPELATVTVGGLTEFDLERVGSVTVGWRYGR